jgi:peptidoglycan/LPS O-acetylase OafA/YrhL
MSGWISLETMAVSGGASAALGLAVLIGVVATWSQRSFGPAESVLAPVLGAMLITLGMQNVLGGFLLAIVGGNEARFLDYGRADDVAAPRSGSWLPIGAP